MNSKIKKLFTCIVFLIFCPTLFATLNHSQKGMLGDLEAIRRIFEEGYAQNEWKKEYTNWDLNDEIDHAKTKVLNNPEITLKEFWKIIQEFIFSTKDYHVSASFYSTEEASLPFTIRSAEGKYFFTYIDEELVDSKFPFVIGDQLLTIDDVEVNEIVTTLKEANVGSNFPKADLAYAEIFLTQRLGYLGHDVPSGAITLKGLSKHTGKKITHKTTWDYSEEKMLGFGKDKDHKKEDKPSPLYRKEFIFPHYKKLFSHKKTAESSLSTQNPESLGAKKSSIPRLGKILWEAEESALFHAYLFKLPNKKTAGYIRIPIYSPSTYTTEDGIKELSTLIESFEQESDILIIDQINNPGGYLNYMEDILSMLTTKSLKIPAHRIKLSQDEIFEAIGYKELIENLRRENTEGTEEAYKDLFRMEKYFDDIIEEWNLNHHFTKPIYLSGIEAIEPHPTVHYSKPILVLINELDMSCGDFFPAILQDNKRAVIFGTRTSGAGGAVNSQSFPNSRGIDSIGYTSTIGIRLDGSYIENSGVTPDVPYDIKAVDLQNNYVEYVKKVNQVIKTML